MSTFVDRPAWPFGTLTPLRYGAILADPPWKFDNWSKAGEWKNASRHYGCLDTGAIAALPVGHLAAPESVLFMWATCPMLPDALRVMAAWGFAYKTCATWAKRTSTDQAWQFAPGYIFRGAIELLLVGTIGEPKRRDTKAARSVRNLIVAPVREHSRKPDATHGIIETLYPGPYAELFARQRRAGWDAWGNQTEKFAAENAESEAA